MPELAEVTRIVHFIRKYLAGKTISKVQAQTDDLIFGKVGTSAEEFQQKMQGKKITGAGQQGKYFWMTMSSPPHPVMHFGMTGWLKIKNTNSHYNRTSNKDDETWPPRFWKFMLEMNDGTMAAFVDMRRLGRVRLVDCPGNDIRQYTPLKENGPDPVADKDIVTKEWLADVLAAKKVPVKALLLDQANISGLGNWMGDEVLYHAKVHPEQYSNTLNKGQIEALHSAIHYVCSTSVDLLGDAEQFPTDWLFHHRWSKGKKKENLALPNGDKIIFLTVGGRTSAVVPAVQKKTGPAAGDIDGGEEEKKPATSKAQGKAKKATATPKKEPVKKEKPSKAKETGDSPKGKRKATQETTNGEKAKKAKTAAKPEEPKIPLRRGRSAAKK